MIRELFVSDGAKERSVVGTAMIKTVGREHEGCVGV